MSELKSISGESCLLLGSIENVDAYLKSADFYISASYAEGLPNTVLEAMASGLPCILSDIPAHRELLGSEDIFFKCGNVKELSNKMKCFVEDSSIDKGNHVRKIVEEQFSSKEMSKKYQAIYVSDG